MAKNINLRDFKRIFETRPITAPLVEGFSGAVGNTPLIRLSSLSELTGCEILGKAEFMNPGGSVKDRAALWMVKDMENKNLLKPGGTVVEGTAGNTGIGLAHICRARGYSCVIYMPDNQSEEKIASLKFLSTVYTVPVVPFTDPLNYNHQASNHAKKLENCVWTNQFDNLANTQAHYESTAPELIYQTNKFIDAFVCSTGTGGTLSGIALYFEKHSPKTKIILADPPGSVLYNKITFGKLERMGLSSITEGIGQGRVTDNLASSLHLIHSAVHIPDEETIKILFRLIHDEGLPLGASSAMNVAAAVKVARQLGPGHTVVTILCDLAYRYAKRLFSRSWLESKNLANSVPEDCLKYLN